MTTKAEFDAKLGVVAWQRPKDAPAKKSASKPT